MNGEVLQQSRHRQGHLGTQIGKGRGWQSNACTRRRKHSGKLTLEAGIVVFATGDIHRSLSGEDGLLATSAGRHVQQRKGGVN